MAGILYQAWRMTSDAAAALRKAVAFDGDREAAERLAAIEGELGPTAADMGNLVADADLHFKAPKAMALPELEPLPDLPGLQAEEPAMATIRSAVPAAVRSASASGAGELAPGAMIAERYR